MTTPLLDRMAEALRKVADNCRMVDLQHAEVDEEIPKLLTEYATRPQPGIPPGGDKGEFVLVPREPTKEMVDAAAEASNIYRRECRLAYCAAIAATPSPAVAQFAPQGEAVRALVAKWRMEHKKYGPLTTRIRYADELEAALGRELAGQGRETKG